MDGVTIGNGNNLTTFWRRTHESPALIRFHPVMSVSLVALGCMLSFEITLEFEVANSVGRLKHILFCGVRWRLAVTQLISTEIDLTSDCM